ncbi:hypothetical protein I0C86_01385 [Plantactinospora sp. S1510]|uniref:Uncharacterized protein n=1 Tax=Plantactinospora alkalitolerans TaxID=2789879 RepID=A0ABS0GN92_9ACTN|nr:hypothetical protein [Plantactinospora alkalitolerans]MBF9127656.1 hypothetical protein [Plantactinospora alkalitolerans]
MTDLLGSDLPLAAANVLADKKSPVSGTFDAIFAVAWVLAVIFLVYVAVKRRR